IHDSDKTLDRAVESAFDGDIPVRVGHQRDRLQLDRGDLEDGDDDDARPLPPRPETDAARVGWHAVDEVGTQLRTPLLEDAIAGHRRRDRAGQPAEPQGWREHATHGGYEPLQRLGWRRLVLELEAADL